MAVLVWIFVLKTQTNLLAGCMSLMWCPLHVSSSVPTFLSPNQHIHYIFPSSPRDTRWGWKLFFSRFDSFVLFRMCHFKAVRTSCGSVKHQTNSSKCSLESYNDSWYALCPCQEKNMKVHHSKWDRLPAEPTADVNDWSRNAAGVFFTHIQTVHPQNLTCFWILESSSKYHFWFLLCRLGFLGFDKRTVTLSYTGETKV